MEQLLCPCTCLYGNSAIAKYVPPWQVFTLFGNRAHERCGRKNAIRFLLPCSLGRVALSSEPKAVQVRCSCKGRKMFAKSRSNVQPTSAIIHAQSIHNNTSALTRRMQLYLAWQL